MRHLFAYKQIQLFSKIRRSQVAPFLTLTLRKCKFSWGSNKLIYVFDSFSRKGCSHTGHGHKPGVAVTRMNPHLKILSTTDNKHIYFVKCLDTGHEFNIYIGDDVHYSCINGELFGDFKLTPLRHSKSMASVKLSNLDAFDFNFGDIISHNNIHYLVCQKYSRFWANNENIEDQIKTPYLFKLPFTDIEQNLTYLHRSYHIIIDNDYIRPEKDIDYVFIKNILIDVKTGTFSCISENHGPPPSYGTPIQYRARDGNYITYHTFSSKPQGDSLAINHLSLVAVPLVYGLLLHVLEFSTYTLSIPVTPTDYVIVGRDDSYLLYCVGDKTYAGSMITELCLYGKYSGSQLLIDVLNSGRLPVLTLSFY